jgi:hypothetical protein
MARYAQMDLADAAIVVMSERHDRCQVLTIDRRDFSTYRRNDRQVVPLVAPRSDEGASVRLACSFLVR